MKSLVERAKKEKIFSIRIMDVWKLNQEKEKRDKEKYVSLSDMVKYYPNKNLEN